MRLNVFIVCIVTFAGIAATEAAPPNRLRIHGEISPGLIVELYVRYVATKKSPFCERTIFPAGAVAPHGETKIHPISSSSGRYDIQLSLEEVDRNRYCMYQPRRVEYVVREPATGRVTSGFPYLIEYSSVGPYKPYLPRNPPGHASVLPQDMECMGRNYKDKPRLDKVLFCSRGWALRTAPNSPERIRAIPNAGDNVDSIEVHFRRIPDNPP